MTSDFQASVKVFHCNHVITKWSDWKKNKTKTKTKMMTMKNNGQTKKEPLRLLNIS